MSASEFSFYSLKIFPFLFIMSIWTAANASEQITVAEGETYNIDKDASYTKYQNEDLNGAVASVSGTLNVNGPASFKNNTGNMGGVIYNEGTVSITSLSGNSVFGSNTAMEGGVIYNADSGKISEISHALFQRNQGEAGGVIYNSNSTGSTGGGNISKIANASFIENSAGVNKGGVLLNSGTVNSIETVAFRTNIASDGGAISNDEYGLISLISNATFDSNYALMGEVKQGGAISNSGVIESISDSSFTGNKAGSLGGAIYNQGKITFNGNNTFSGNVAEESANDIYNSGNIIIADGMTIMDGGIKGTGTLTIAENAVLNIGSTVLEQGKLVLDGTLAASILNPSSFAAIDIDEISIGENAVLDLTLGAVGKYDFGAAIDINNIKYADLIYNVSIDGTNIVVETKDVSDISNNTNISSDAALVLVGLANSSDSFVNSAALIAQNALKEGDIDYVEQESAKLRNEDKPIVHSVATAVNNQVLSVTSDRMSSISGIGRSGGDWPKIDYGVWAQGLMNRTKYSDKFTGDTNGISVGFDTLIKDKYTIGIGYAYNETEVETNTRDTEISSNSLFLYGQYKPSKWYVGATLTYTMADYTEMATAFENLTINPEYDVDSFGGQMVTGYELSSGIIPEVAIRYLHINQDAYNNGIADISDTNTNYLTGVAGLKYGFVIEAEGRLKLRPEIRAAATYDFISDEAVAIVTVPGLASYKVTSENLSRFGGEVGVGLSAMYNAWVFSVNYDLDIHKDYTSQTGMLKFRYKF